MLWWAVLVCLATKALPHRTEATDNVDVMWFAPFLTGSEAGMEASSFVAGLNATDDLHMSIVQHGGHTSHRYLSSMDVIERDVLLKLMIPEPGKIIYGSGHNNRGTEAKPDPRNSVVICHSDPSSWHPTQMDTSRCPPKGTDTDAATLYVKLISLKTN